jgi:homoserine kinase
MFGAVICDVLIEPVRAKLIPGFREVKKAALRSGALGCSISGAGASVFAVADDSKRASKIGSAMQKAFARHGLAATVTVTRMDSKGARVL